MRLRFRFTMTMLSAILWDNDGVLVDTERYYFEANRIYLRTYGIELSEAQFFQWYLCESRGAWHLLDADADAEQHARWRQERNRIHLQLLEEADSLMTPGIAHLLGHLQGRVDMGIVTSATRASFDTIHRKLDLLRHFGFVLTAETYARSKPFPDPYLLGLARLGKPAGECLVIEDSPRGLEAARAAGLRCIILRNALSRHHDFVGAYRVVDSVDALRVEIDALLGQAS